MMIEKYRRNESVYRSYPLHSKLFAACESGARFGCARLYMALRVCVCAFVVACAFPCAFSCTRVYKDCFVDVIKVDGSTMATARKMMAAARVRASVQWTGRARVRACNGPAAPGGRLVARSRGKEGIWRKRFDRSLTD